MQEKTIRNNLKKIFDEYRDACIEKAILRIKQHPERSAFPNLDFDQKFLNDRLQEEYTEYLLNPNTDELTDIGNFASWLFFRKKRMLE